MNSPRIFVCVIILLFMKLLAPVGAQVTLQGTVTNKKKPINANVIIYQSSDSTIVAFSSTDSAGFFELIFEREKVMYFIKAQAMGFEESVIFLQPKDSLTSQVMNFDLVESSNLLSEFVVKGKVPPYTINKDTVTYNPRVFTDGMEHSVEDLLRKLPGIKVSESGDITVKGKAIEKITLEGEDVFGKNYKLLSKNIAANLIDKVEAIDNYNENPLLRDLDKSNKIILNLTITNKKSLFFGNASAELGTRIRRELSSTAFSLTKQLKVGLIANTNNIGIDPVQNSQYELNDDKDAFKQINHEATALSLLSNTGSFNIPDLPSQRYTFNNAGLVGSNLNYQVHKKAKLKGFLFLNKDNIRLSNQINTNFLLPDVDFGINDSASFFRKPKLFTGQIVFDFLPTKSSSVRFTAIRKSTKTNSSFDINSRNFALTESMVASGFDEVTLESYQLSSVKRLKGKNALIANVNYVVNSMPQTATIQSGRFGEMIGKNNVSLLLEQRNALRSNELQGNLTWRSSFKKSTLTLDVTGSSRQESLFSDLFFTNKNSEIFRNDSLLNNKNDYQKSSIVLDGDYKLSLGNLKFSIGGGLHHINLSFTNSLSNTNKSQNLLFFNPIGGFSFQINETQKFIAFITSQRSVPNIIDLSSGYAMTNYRTFQRGFSDINVVKSNYFSSIYSNMNWSRLLTIVGNLSAGRTFSPYVYRYDISNNLNLMTKQVASNSSTSMFATNWLVEKLISNISVKVKYEVGYSFSENLNLINTSTLSKIAFQDVNNAVHLSTVFNGAFNCDFGTQVNLSKLIGSNLNTTAIKPFGIIRVKPIKTMTLKLINETFIWQNAAVQNITNFMDVVVQVNLKNPKWGLELKGANITNSKTAFFREFTNYSFSEKSYSLQPRYFSFRLDRKF